MTTSYCELSHSTRRYLEDIFTTVDHENSLIRHLTADEIQQLEKNNTIFDADKILVWKQSSINFHRIKRCFFEGTIILGQLDDIKNNVGNSIDLAFGIYDTTFSGNCIIFNNVIIRSNRIIHNTLISSHSCIIGCGCITSDSFFSVNTIQVGPSAGSGRRVKLDPRMTYDRVCITVMNSQINGEQDTFKSSSANHLDEFHPITIIAPDAVVSECPLVRNTFVGGGGQGPQQYRGQHDSTVDFRSHEHYL